MKKYLVIFLVLFVIILSGTTFYFWQENQKNIVVENKEIKNNNRIGEKKEEINNNQKDEISKEYKVENVNEFQYNYQNTEFAEKEKQVLEIGKKEAIKFLGEKGCYKEMPFKVKREKFNENNYNSFLKTELNLLDNDYIWHFSGTLFCKEGYICNGGTIEVIISDKDLKILKVFHSK